MEKIYNVLTNVPDQNKVTQFIQEQYNDPNFGSILFQILQNNSPTIPHDDYNFLFKCCFLLKNWAKINWENFNIDQKIQYFDCLKNLILSIQLPYVLSLSDAFIDIAKRESINLNIYEVHYNDFFIALSTPQNYSMKQLIALLNIIDFASHKYKETKGYKIDEASFFLARIVEVILPYLGNEQFLQSEEGCNILELALSIFKYPFIRVQPPKLSNFSKSIGNASIPLNFSVNIEISFIQHTFTNTSLLCSAVRFLKHIYASYKKCFKAEAQNILQTHFQLLSVAMEPIFQDGINYNLISNILKIIEQFKKSIPPNQNLIDILLQSAKLTPTDVINFSCNPNIFYYNVYYTCYLYDNHDPPHLSRSILTFIFLNNPEISPNLIEYMISLPPTENVVRCLGTCINIFKEEDDFILPESIIPYYLQLIQNPIYHQDPLMVASILNFLRYLVHYIPDEQKMEIMHILPTYFVTYQQYAIITLFCIRLLKKLVGAGIPPFENAIQFVIQSLPNSFTSDGLKTIKRMAQKSLDGVIPYADIIFENVFADFNESFMEVFQSEDQNPEELDIQADITGSNLLLCANLIESVGPSLVKPYFVEIVKSIFENDLTDLEDQLVNLLIAILGSGSPLIPDFLHLIINACQQETWEGHSGYFMRPLLSLISSNPQIFIQLNISRFLGEFCNKMLLQNLSDPSNWLEFGTLLSWILILDGQNNNEININDIQNIVQAGTTVCLMENVKIELISSYLEILATVAVSRQIFPNEQIIHLIINAVNSNWALRICQKQLYVIFFLSLAAAQNNLADLVVPISFNLMNEIIKQKNVSERDYFYKQTYPHELDQLTLPFPFKSPIESFLGPQIFLTGLQFCQKETIEVIRQSFPELFNQITGQEQQQPTL